MSKKIAFDSDELLPCVCGNPTLILECGHTIMTMLRCPKCNRRCSGLLNEHIKYWNLSMRWNKNFLEQPGD